MSDKPTNHKRTNRADVMISSTSNDLPRHRKTVIDAIWRVGMFPLSMERDEAVADSDAIQFSLDMVDDAEVYVGIFGFRYGYIPKDAARNPNKISVTEMEYRRAVERDIPILIFIMDDNHPIKAKDKDTAANLRKLDKLKSEMKTKHIVSFFKSVTELRENVLKSLYDLKVRQLVDTTPDPEDDHEPEPDAAGQPPKPPALTIPAPPNLYSVPPYILTNKFIGRVSELDQLDSWAQSVDPLLVIEAIGGMGKSALTWEWVNDKKEEMARARKAMPNLKGIFWWSFYERGATMEAFIRHALAYITRRNPDELELRQMRYEERANRLLTELAREPYLLVLDGLERVLLAYHRWDAAQMRDDTLDDPTNNNSPRHEGEGQGVRVSDPHNIRACIDPRDADFLQRLSIAKPGKFLISSRLMPRALEDERDPLPGVRQIKLYGLNLEDAFRLVQERGVKKADRPTLDAFMTSIGCHSLLLKMVAGRIQNYRPAPGNFDKWYAAEGKEIHLSKLEIKQKRTHILQSAFEGLDATKRKLLSQVAAFQDAVSYDTLSVFNPYLPPKPQEVKKPQKDFSFAKMMLDMAETPEEKAQYQKRLDEEEAQYANNSLEQQKAAYDAYLKALEAYPKSVEYRAGVATFDMALTELEERGLLQWDRKKDSYDLHPVVRGYSFDLLEQDDKVQTFDRIHDYFQSRPEEDVEKALEIEDLKNTIEIYRALLGAGKYDAAADFFDSRLFTVLVENIAAYPKALELLTPLFRDGFDKLPPLKDVSQQSSMTTHFASILYYLGRTKEALALEGPKLKLNLDQKNASYLGTGLQNYAISLLRDNHFASSLHARELALALTEAADDARGESLSHLFLLSIYKTVGEWAAVERAYAAFNAQLPSSNTAYWQTDAEKYYSEMLICRNLDAAATLAKAEKFAQQSRNALSFRQIQGLRGEVVLTLGRLDEAADYFQNRLMLEQKAGAPNGAKESRGGFARTRAAQGRTDEARRLVVEGIPYIDAAETFLTLGDTAQAKDYALKAYKAAWADGPPYSFWWSLERSKKVLDTLGEPYPDMPPFDPAKVAPIPYEAEIRAFIEELKAEKAAKEAEAAKKKGREPNKKSDDD